MAELIIAEREFDDVVVLDLAGDITFGEGNITLRQAIRHHLANDRTRIWLNLENVCYVDSSGIGELISSLTAITRDAGGQLKLLNPSPRLMQLLEISKLLTIFDISRDESRAAAFKR